MKNIIISDKEKLELIEKNIIQDGAEEFFVLSDFDRTLTKAFINNRKVPSLISVLRDEGYLGEEYSKKAYAMYDKYSPFEEDEALSFENRKKMMEKWWREHFELLVESDLNKKHLEQIVDSGLIEFREGVIEFLEILRDKKIPLVIMSSTGVSGEVIELYLKKQGVDFENIYLAANRFEYDSGGKVIDINEPIIHVLNKDETGLSQFDFYDEIKNRSNILLMGDGVSDIGMAKGLDYKNILKIGFLNYEVEKNKKVFENNFDVVVVGDGNFMIVNEIVERIN